jgi:hypothetical protein
MAKTNSDCAQERQLARSSTGVAAINGEPGRQLHSSQDGDRAANNETLKTMILDSFF